MIFNIEEIKSNSKKAMLEEVYPQPKKGKLY